MSFKSLFLPVGLIVAILIGMLLPILGTLASKIPFPVFSLQYWLVVMVFLISGFKLKAGDFRIDRQFASVLGFGLVINLLLGPLAAVLV